MTLKILLNGCNGRMGRAISGIASQQGAEIAFPVDVGDDPAAGIEGCDVVVDFSLPTATLSLIQLASGANKPVVIGTTGHTPEQREQILIEASSLPVVWANNFSVGVNLLFYLTQKAASILDSSYNPEIVEMHHRHKVDAPSGTAVRLLEIVRRARALEPGCEQHGREGVTGARPEGQIGVHALRGGDVVGEHTVHFAGEGERIELSHRASDRSIFAQGALRAAHWVLSQPPGLYDMQDVLGLK